MDHCTGQKPSALDARHPSHRQPRANRSRGPSVRTRKPRNTRARPL